MSKHIHDGRSHCPACALEKIGWQKQEIADLEAENARLRLSVDWVEGHLGETRRERDRAEALAERRGEALEEIGRALHRSLQRQQGQKVAGDGQKEV